MFWLAVFKPFVAFAMLLPAWFIKRWLERRMKPGPWKEFLLKRRGDEMQAWFEQQDRKMFDSAKGAWKFIRGSRR